MKWKREVWTKRRYKKSVTTDSEVLRKLDISPTFEL